MDGHNWHGKSSKASNNNCYYGSIRIGYALFFNYCMGFSGMTDEQLKDLIAKATPGPWEWASIYAYDVHNLVSWVTGDTFPNGDPRYVEIHDDGSACGEYGPSIDVDSADATLIALAPTLAAEVVRLREALEFISIVDQSCGGNFTFKEMADASIRIARQALLQK